MANESYNVKHIIILLIFSSLAILAICLRLWSRRLQKKGLDWNDYLIIAGLIFALSETYFAVYVCFFELATGSTGNQSHGTEDPALVLANKSIFIDPIIWVIAVTCIRSSIISLYIRIFPPRCFRLICYLALMFNLVFAVATILTDCLICQPIAYRWNRSLDGRCGTQKSFDLFVGIANLVLDIITVTLPMKILWGLHVALKKKLILIGMFSMGFGICVLTLYRLYATVSLDPDHWQEGYAVIILLTCLEAHLGVVNACLPVLKPMVNKIRALFLSNGQGILRPFTSRNFSRPLQIKQSPGRSSKRYTSIREGPSSISMSASWVRESNQELDELGHADTSRNGKALSDGDAATILEKLPRAHVRDDMIVNSVPLDKGQQQA